MALTKVSTPAIKDEAITLAKLLHGDSNNDGKFLRANNGADPTFETIDLTALSASNLTSGTLPDARFPSTLPAISGANLTNLDASDLASGTIPDARFPATLPAASAANLTNIPAANITGTLPAIDGSNLTGISAGVSVGNAGDERVITSDGTNLDAESLFVYKASNNTVGIGLASPNPTASYYQGACLHIHQAASGSNAGSQLHLTNAYGGSGASDGSQVSHYSSSLYINNQENGDTYFYNNGSPNLTIKASGNVGIGTQSPTDKLHVNGTALIGSNLYLNNNTYIAAGKGIYFDGQSNSQHYLDDYEEGTFAPNNSTTGLNSTQGYYLKIGNWVWWNIRVAFPSNSSGVYAYLDGFPFTTISQSHGSYQFGGYATYSTRGVWYVLMGNNASRIYMYNSSGSQLNHADFSSKELRMQGWAKVQ